MAGPPQMALAKTALARFFLTKRRLIILLLVMAQDWTHGLRLDPPNGAERKQHLHDILTKRRIISLLLVMAQDWTHGLRLDPPNGANPLRKFDTFTRQSDISDKSSLDDTLVSNLRLEPHPPRILASCSTFAGLLCLALVALPCAGAPSGRAWALPF